MIDIITDMIIIETDHFIKEIEKEIILEEIIIGMIMKIMISKKDIMIIKN